MKSAIDRFPIGTPFAVPTRTSALYGGRKLRETEIISFCLLRCMSMVAGLALKEVLGGKTSPISDLISALREICGLNLAPVPRYSIRILTTDDIDEHR